MSKRALLFFLLSCALSLSACKRKGVSAPKELAALSDKEAEAFALTLTAALNTCDESSLYEIMDVNSMMRRAVRQSDARASQERELLEGMRRNGGDIHSQFCGTPEASGGLHFLRVHHRAGKQTLLFRNVTGESLNYIEFYAGKATNGSIKIDNVYLYMNGQTLVETLSQMLDVLLGDDSIISAFENISTKISEDPAAALRSFAEMPEKARNSKPLQLLKIQAASGIDDATYAAAIREYEILFPNDPSLNLVSIDGYIVRKNYSEALKVIDKLDKSLGGDSYLDELRVSLLLEEGKDLARATELAEESLQAQPESEDAHYLLLGVHVANHNFAGAVAVMRMMGERFELVFEEEGLDPSDPNYAALKESPEWEAYKAKTSNTP